MNMSSLIWPCRNRPALITPMIAQMQRISLSYGQASAAHVAIGSISNPYGRAFNLVEMPLFENKPSVRLRTAADTRVMRALTSL